jgi:hypothetical protein
MKLVRLIKMCVNETYSKIYTSKNLSDAFHIQNGQKQGDDLWPLLFNYTLEYTIWKVQENQGRLELNGTHLFLVCADDVNKLGRNLYTIKKEKEKQRSSVRI